VGAPDLGDVTWRVSARSGANGNRVEVARLNNAVALRDRRHPAGPALLFTRAEWAAFREGGGHGSLIEADEPAY
jgi:hypothetical protein